MGGVKQISRMVRSSSLHEEIRIGSMFLLFDIFDD